MSDRTSESWTSNEYGEVWCGETMIAECHGTPQERIANARLIIDALQRLREAITDANHIGRER